MSDIGVIFSCGGIILATVVVFGVIIYATRHKGGIE